MSLQNACARWSHGHAALSPPTGAVPRGCDGPTTSYNTSTLVAAERKHPWASCQSVRREQEHIKCRGGARGSTHSNLTKQGTRPLPPCKAGVLYLQVSGDPTRVMTRIAEQQRAVFDAASCQGAMQEAEKERGTPKLGAKQWYSGQG